VVMFQKIGLISLPPHRGRGSAVSVLEGAVGELEHVTFNGTPERPSRYRAAQDRNVDRGWDRITNDTPHLIPTPSFQSLLHASNSQSAPSAQ